MNVRRQTLAVVGTAMLVCASGLNAIAESSWAQPKVPSGRFPIRKVCLMPAETEMDKLGVKTTEKMTKDSDDWAVALRVLIEAHLKTVGIGFDSATDPAASGASDNDIQQAIDQIQEKYNALSGELNKKPRAIGKGAYTLGDQVAMLPCAATSDVLVFIRGEGVIPTPGRAGMAALAGGILEQGAIVTIAFADAKTGEILAMIRFRNVGDFLGQNQEDAFSAPLDAGLADINLGSARKLERAREFSTPAQR